MKKLNFNKSIVANLNSQEQNNIQGGGHTYKNGCIEAPSQWHSCLPPCVYTFSIRVCETNAEYECVIR